MICPTVLKNENGEARSSIAVFVTKITVFR